MALTHLKIKIFHPSEPRKADLDFLIDSGAVYSVVPSTILKKLNIKPDEERTFTLANGQTITRKLGGAKFEYSGHLGHAPVIFGEKGDSTLLGAISLEAMGMALDPLKRRLMPLPMVLG